MNSQNEPDPAVNSRVTNTLSQVIKVLDAQGAKYASIGGFGVALRGNVRATQDVDIRGILTKNAGGLDLVWVRPEAANVELGPQRLDDFEQPVRDFYRADSDG